MTKALKHTEAPMMKHPVMRRLYFLAALLIIPGLSFSQQIMAQEDPPEIYETDIDENMEVLDAGPVHEAFAETSVSDTEPGIIVPKTPPDPIEEVPPEHEDLEEGAVWISGYWAWDNDRNDFIWISGTWRVPPSGREWTAGYWVEAEGGYQWISGYWTNSTVAEAEYLPQPPETLDEGPNSGAPSDDHAWVPGCWVWDDGYYVWRPGYWMRMRPDRIWVPAYYVWTPHGYIFAGGYWDYVIARRGILYAPVFFHHRIYTRIIFPFTPSFVIGFSVFSDSLFVRPRYRHYYFGNYYASKYYKRGIYPWFYKHKRRHVYDPIYAHERFKHRRVRDWETTVRANFKKRRDHENRRHPHNGNDERVRRPGKHPGDSVVRHQDNRDDRVKERINVDKKNVVRVERPKKKPGFQKHDAPKRVQQPPGKPGKIEERKTVFRKHDAPKVRRNQKVVKERVKDESLIKRVERPTSPKVRPPESRNSVADKRERAIRNHRAPRPDNDPVVRRSTPPESQQPRNWDQRRPAYRNRRLEEVKPPVAAERNRDYRPRGRNPEEITDSPAFQGGRSYDRDRFSHPGRGNSNFQGKMFNGRNR